MSITFTKEQGEQFSEILESLGRNLDISESQYDNAVKSYTAVGGWLSGYDSELAMYQPTIKPQGSFMLGTMIKPIHENDDLDIDLVCQLTGKKEYWTQSDLKQIVGNRIKANGVYERMLQRPDGRRCWTLRYSEVANYHMDILPSIVSQGYQILLEKSFSDIEREMPNFDNLAIRITDKKHELYTTSTQPEDWLKSNPFGYGKWFFQRAELPRVRAFSMNESIQEVPKFQKEKLPLQRVIQILKRHRDMMFNGDEAKPISIIITTLAGRAYQKETNILTALLNIVNRISLPGFIEERFDINCNKTIKWISNPANSNENFADKWPENPQKQANFYKWLAQVQKDISQAIDQVDRGLHNIKESLQQPFGKNEVSKAFSDYGEHLRLKRELGTQFITNTGTLGLVGTLVKNHNFHGEDK